MKYYLYISAENDRSRKHGMEEYINSDPITFEHHKMFEYLQRQCLDWRLADPYASLVSQRDSSYSKSDKTLGKMCMYIYSLLNLIHR